MATKILIYGANGFIGKRVSDYLRQNTHITVLQGTSRCEDENAVRQEIQSHDVDRVICCIGRSSGKNVYSTSFVEKKLDVNLQDNLLAPMVVLKCCNDANIHFTHIGDGCIFFDEEDNTVFSEEDTPDMTCSAHAIVKSYTEKLIQLFSKNFLQLRLRYPITGDFHPKCLLSKLLSYDKVVNKNTSVSIFRDILPVMMDLVLKQKTGTFHLVNPGSINLLETKCRLKNMMDRNQSVSEFTMVDHNVHVGPRSHVILSTRSISSYQVEDAGSSLETILQSMRTVCQPLLHCLCCLKPNQLVLNLGYQPLANDFHLQKEVCSNFPLALMVCPSCFHCQLSHAVDPSILFRNYKYVSGTSQTGLDYFKKNALFVHEYKKLEKGKILDIACNDGSQLDFFKELGWETFGVDPAENLCPIAREKGHTIVCEFWNDEVASLLPVMDVITAQNVFAHTQYIDAFLQSCKKVMGEHSSLFIQTSQKNMILNGEFDTTYHEHISFFCTRSMKTLVERNGLHLYRVLECDIHGDSYLFEITLGFSHLEKASNVSQHLDEEMTHGLYSMLTYEKFGLNARRCMNHLMMQIEAYREKGYTCVGFGAAAKGQTVVCFGNIDLEYIIDENPLKIGTYSPKLDIPIVAPTHFEEDSRQKFLVVILAWNFAKEITQKIRSLQGTKEIVIIDRYFPDLNFA